MSYSYILLNKDDLPRDGSTYEFAGSLYDDTEVSFIWVEMPPGEGIRLHKHAYKEIFIIQEGHVTFTVDTITREAHAGQVVIVPAGVAHKFVNSGDSVLRQIDIHASKTIVTEWLEEQ